MCFAQAYVDALRNGDSLKLMQFKTAIEARYGQYKSPIGQDELQQLVSYELAKTDIQQNDFVKMHVLERFVDFDKLQSDLSDTAKFSLSNFLSASLTAVSIKTVENYKMGLPEKLDSEPAVKDFLENESDFSTLVRNDACQNKQDQLMRDYCIRQSSGPEVTNLFQELKNNPDNKSFCDAIIKEFNATKKVKQLKPICQTYLEHLASTIQAYIKKNKEELLNDFPKEKGASLVAWINQNAGKLPSKKSDNPFNLAVEKYLAVNALYNGLEKNDAMSSKKLQSFTQLLGEKKKLLNTRRDSAGMTFLKGLASVLSLGIAALCGLWKPKGKKTLNEMQTVLSKQI